MQFSSLYTLSKIGTFNEPKKQKNWVKMRL